MKLVEKYQINKITQVSQNTVQMDTIQMVDTEKEAQEYCQRDKGYYYFKTWTYDNER